MSRFQFLLQSLVFYWRTNLAVLLGVIAATAVTGGALIVGDSVRGSLRQMTLDRLGEIDQVLQSPRFFREALGDELGALPEFQRDFSAAAPAILLRSSLERSRSSESERTARAGQVNLYGLDDRLWNLTEHGDLPAPRDRDLILSQRVAEQLHVAAGDKVLVWVEVPSSIPRDSLLGKREQTSTQIPLTVKAILPDSSGVGRLGLRPNQQLPLNAFVALKTLQTALDLAEVKPSRRNREGSPARVNSLFVSARTPAGQSPQAAKELNTLLAGRLQLTDLDLLVRPDEQYGYLSVESRRMILEEPISKAALKTAAELNWPTSPVLVYLANEISTSKSEKTYAMYSVVAGLDLASEKPFGPYEFAGPPPKLPLGPEEIVLNDWIAEDLQAQVGDTIHVKYHVVGSRGELPEPVRDFRLAGILKLDGTRAADRGLTPEVKGITDAKTLDEWEQPFEMKFDRITRRDEDYWEKYRATPKAFVNLQTAQELWRSRYGELTSLRVAPPADQSLNQAAAAFSTALLPQLPLAELGMLFADVKQQGLAAAGGTTDFGGLFIGFSFFLIVSAAILIGLLFRLGIEQRASSVGLLLAVGWEPRRVSRTLLQEGLLLVLVGGLLGVAAAIGYAALMLYGLKTWWIGAIGTRFLNLYLTPLSAFLGFVISAGLALFAIWWGMRQLRALSVRGLLAGATQPELTALQQTRRGGRATWIAGASALCAVLLMLGALLRWIPDAEAFSGLSWATVAFFLGGLLCLVAGLSFLSAWIDSDRSVAVRGRGLWGMGRLGMRNAARFRSRSVLTVGLIASATFVIVAVAAGQRNPAVERPEKFSGNGGFTLVAEADNPILYDLNTPAGRDKLNLSDASTATALKALGRVVPFRVKPGDDASCLNLFQTRLPTILGVPREMIERGGFKFVGARGENPWEILNERTADGAIPVLGDMNTLMYSMHKGVGDSVFVPNPEHPQQTLKIAGMFDGAVFQGMLLMAEDHFQEIFPDQAGYQYFLIEVPLADATAVGEVLETKLDAYGFDAERVSDRLADFLAVQNTYLSTFQTLGGLGLLLGTFGLATVMLRNVLERRSELALLRAVGFSNRHLTWLVLWENAFLLGWGLASGTAAALLAMTPHLLSIGADIPWASVGLILGLIFTVGMLAAFLAVLQALRTPVLATLRAEQ